MTEQDISRYQDLIVTTATDVGIKILAAIAVWVIGRWLIGMVLSMVRASLEKQKVDPTVLRYLGSVSTVTLNPPGPHHDSMPSLVVQRSRTSCTSAV